MGRRSGRRCGPVLRQGGSRCRCIRRGCVEVGEEPVREESLAHRHRQIRSTGFRFGLYGGRWTRPTFAGTAMSLAAYQPAGSSKSAAWTPGARPAAKRSRRICAWPPRRSRSAPGQRPRRCRPTAPSALKRITRWKQCFQPQRLPVHASRAGGASVGGRDQPRRNPPVPLPPRQPAEFGSLDVAPDRQRRAHRQTLPKVRRARNHAGHLGAARRRVGTPRGGYR
jgi:hypothetical protein